MYDYTKIEHSSPEESFTYLLVFILFLPWDSSQAFPLIKSPSLFILLCSTLQQLVASWAQLHLDTKKTRFHTTRLQLGLQDVSSKERRQSQAREILHHLGREQEKIP
ncbi:hypothetical protein EYF80_008686 [Liparis tanakae]|uniref:Uncharacterized protein n=1 Tax=Liparis tanakae TaxID=230148 RepID=A0A4Z2ISR3_9TELE|nr:hypothetical protein EYF80_008686 [Liparis tanakae]